MTETMRLSALLVGEHMRITAVESEETMKKRLLDLGFCPNTHVRCLYRAPLGDPIAYCVRGTVIALRKKDAAGVIGIGDGYGSE